MADLNFPVSPVNGQTYTSGQTTWTYDAAFGVWNITSSGPTGYTGSQGALLPWSVKTANYTAVDGDRILADTSGGTFTITLPATPTNGAYVQISDAEDFNAVNLTVARNGSTIEGLTDDVVLDLKGCTFEFIYNGSTWQVTATTGAQGYVGSYGYTGSRGYTGSQGPIGYTGSFGDTGYTGSQGFTGSAGFTGSTGPTIYPSAGIAVSTGSAWGSSKTSPTGDIVGTSDTQILSNKTFQDTIFSFDVKEKITVSATAATGTININVLDGQILYYTTNASGNFTINVRGNASTTLDSLLLTGETITVTFLNTNGATAYYNTAVQIDGSSITPNWQGGTAPSAGNASSIDGYSYTIIKTGSATFKVLAAQTQFK